MAWTYEARMERAIARLIEDEILDLDASEMFNRARFFGRYAFRVALSPTLESWHRFDELKEQLHAGLDPLDAHIVSVKPTYDFYVYGNDPSIIRWVQQYHANFFVNGVRQTNPAHWGKPLPKQNTNKGLFYGDYRFRVKLRNPVWGECQTNLDQLAELELDHKLVLQKYSNSKTPELANGKTRATFLYVKKLNEVLVLKLMFADQVAEVEDRN